jgi:hypothetical protein
MPYPEIYATQLTQKSPAGNFEMLYRFLLEAQGAGQDAIMNATTSLLALKVYNAMFCRDIVGHRQT